MHDRQRHRLRRRNLADVGGSWGSLPEKGVTVAAEYRHHDRTNRASFDPRDQIVAGDAGTNAVAEPNHRWGDPDTSDLMTFLNASVPLNATGTRVAYAFGGYSRRDSNSAGFYRRALDNRNWPQIYPLGFLPVLEPTVVDASGAAGIHGVRGKWNYDFSGEYGHNSFAFTIGDTLNVSLGPTSPKSTFDAGSLMLNQVVGNADVSRAVPIRGLAAPLNIAFGGEYRRENYQIQAGEPDSYRDGGVPNQFGDSAAIGAQVFPGFRPSNEVNTSRNSVAPTWTRRTSISGCGSVRPVARNTTATSGTIDGKLTARVQPTQYFLVRGSISTGFRAPSLAQSFFSSTATNFLDLGQGLVPVESLTLPVDSPAAQVLGATPLKPESSRNAGAGMVITPVPALEVAIDYYHIAIDDRIVLSGNFTAAPIAALLAPFGANGARFFTNAIDTRTNGVDLTANYRIRLRAGDVQLRAAYNNTNTDIVGTVATPPQLAAYASVLFDRIEQRRIECGQPQDNLRIGGDWRGRRFGVDLNGPGMARSAASHIQLMIRDREVANRRRRSSPAIYLLASGQRPVRRVPGSQYDRQFVQRHPDVSSQSPFGMNGRTLYARLRWTF